MFPRSYGASYVTHMGGLGSTYQNHNALFRLGSGSRPRLARPDAPLNPRGTAANPRCWGLRTTWFPALHILLCTPRGIAVWQPSMSSACRPRLVALLTALYHGSCPKSMAFRHTCSTPHCDRCRPGARPITFVRRSPVEHDDGTTELKRSGPGARLPRGAPAAGRKRPPMQPLY